MKFLMLSDAAQTELPQIVLSEVSSDTRYALIQRYPVFQFSCCHHNDKPHQPFFVHGLFGTNCESEGY